eukprot:TRINITY_DN9460_c0_g1_i1.p1 TRINITY_DN9460_c0_g1~~TRINITY_DN9460_c0_g1_i1.p1  ORF type:complete len:652 (-),score=100.09 TRINITY_DN9460_c0_g1_i1:430-2385(-)
MPSRLYRLVARVFKGAGNDQVEQTFENVKNGGGVEKKRSSIEEPDDQDRSSKEAVLADEPGSAFVSSVQEGFHDKYKLNELLGKGNFAAVYATTHLPTAQNWAVKVTYFRTAHDPDQVDRSARDACQIEIMTLAALGSGCRFVCEAKEAFVDDVFSYIIMEKCAKTLVGYLMSLPDITSQVLWKIFADMMTGISYVHSLNIVHRDIKPDNLLTSVTGDAKLCDFGLAKVLKKKQGKTKGIFGTAPFMSPEMLAGGPYGVKTDVWSAGVMMYVLLFGQFPYHADPTAKNLNAGMKMSILKGVPEPTFSAVIPELDITEAAVECLRLLLVRQPAMRIRANEAEGVIRKFVTALPEDPEYIVSSTSRRPLLRHAMKAGAFTVNPAKVGNSEIEERINKLLAGLQAQSAATQKLQDQARDQLYPDLPGTFQDQRAESKERDPGTCSPHSKAGTSVTTQVPTPASSRAASGASRGGIAHLGSLLQAQSADTQTDNAGAALSPASAGGDRGSRTASFPCSPMGGRLGRMNSTRSTDSSSASVVEAQSLMTSKGSYRPEAHFSQQASVASSCTSSVAGSPRRERKNTRNDSVKSGDEPASPTSPLSAGLRGLMRPIVPLHEDRQDDQSPGRERAVDRLRANLASHGGLVTGSGAARNR